MSSENERRTRRTRIDPKLVSSGWRVAPFDSFSGLSQYNDRAIEEYETDNGPADYALCVDGVLLGMVEAKRLTLGPQNVLTQAERYSRGASNNPLYFDGFHVPFLYSTNGEIIWFRDVRHQLNSRRRVAHFHTPAALAELMDRGFDAAWRELRSRPNDEPRMRPYQLEANDAIEQ